MDESELVARIDAPVEVHGSIPNTTDRIRQLARDGAPHGAMAVADELTAANGRNGRAWSAPSGGSWSSTLLRPAFGPEHVGRLTFAAGVAVAEAVGSFGPETTLKWPNDVLVDGAKIAGILTESVHGGIPVAGKPVDEVFPEDGPALDYVSLGVGINANVDPAAIDADREVTTMRDEIGESVDTLELAARLHEDLLDRCAQASTAEGFRELLDDWRTYSETLGSDVRIERRGASAVEGRARDVTDTGALVVEADTDTVVVTEGECRRLRRR